MVLLAFVLVVSEAMSFLLTFYCTVKVKSPLSKEKKFHSKHYVRLDLGSVKEIALVQKNDLSKCGGRGEPIVALRSEYSKDIKHSVKLISASSTRIGFEMMSFLSLSGVLNLAACKKKKPRETSNLTNMLSKVKHRTAGYYIAVYCVGL